MLPDGRNRAKPTLHVFDPLGSTLDAANQQSYVVTFLGEQPQQLQLCFCPSVDMTTLG